MYTERLRRLSGMCVCVCVRDSNHRRTDWEGVSRVVAGNANQRCIIICMTSFIPLLSKYDLGNMDYLAVSRAELRNGSNSWSVVGEWGWELLSCLHLAGPKVIRANVPLIKLVFEKAGGPQWPFLALGLVRWSHRRTSAKAAFLASFTSTATSKLRTRSSSWVVSSYKIVIGFTALSFFLYTYWCQLYPRTY